MIIRIITVRFFHYDLRVLHFVEQLVFVRGMSCDSFEESGEVMRITKAKMKCNFTDTH